MMGLHYQFRVEGTDLDDNHGVGEYRAESFFDALDQFNGDYEHPCRGNRLKKVEITFDPKEEHDTS